MLNKIGSPAYAQQTQREIARALEQDRQQTRARAGSLLAPRTLPIVITGIVLAIFQQWCGINVIFNYAQEILLRPVSISTAR